MLRAGVRWSPRAIPPTSARLGFVNQTRSMAEGATGSGAARPGGIAQGDAYTRREKANEDFYVREKEREKLRLLKEKLKAQRAHLDELDKHIEEMTKDQGGEHN